MTDDRRRRGKLTEDTQIVDEAAECGSDPDVEVFSLAGESESDPDAAQRPGRGKWLETARTAIWEGRDSLPGVAEYRQRVRDESAAATGPHREDTGRYRSLAASTPRPRAMTPEPPPPVARSGNYPVVRPPRYDAEVLEDDYPPRGGGPQLQIEAPARIDVRAVARISPDPRLAVIGRPDSPVAEQYRVLAMKLREERLLRAVSVASPTTGGDGHVAAANLALALAEGGRTNVVLVDGDLRGSGLAQLFDVQLNPGLGEQIRRHRRSPEDSWSVFNLSANLRLMPAGQAEKNPASLLNAEVMHDLMHELRRMFDIIVLNTAPIIESADVNILQDHVDGAVLVVRAGFTRRDSVTASVERLGEDKFVGCVLTDARRRVH